MPSPAHVPEVSRVIAWFGREGRMLPWREPGAEPWAILVSEVMLQQTPVARVLPVWSSWMQRWPTSATLATASTADVLREWGRLGYPRRALRLRECAQVIVREHGGRVPATEAELLALPGVGAYTAAAVLAFAFGERSVVLDTNVRRVIARAWVGSALPPAHLTRAEEALAASLVPVDASESVRWNVGAMELGALVCTARSPRCRECPIHHACAWFGAGQPESTAPRRASQGWAGTDRQVRGRILAVLRDAQEAVNVSGHESLRDVEPGQLDRCLESLLVDHLIRLDDAERGTYRL